MRTNIPKESFTANSFIRLKDNNWLEKYRVAGHVTAGTLSLLEQEVKTGTTKSLLELDKLAETYIRDNGCTPTFLMYKGFPNSVCVSTNRQLVHGIPTNYHLQEGDIVSFDLGATYQGAIGDSAITMIYGQPKSERHLRLIEATQEALMRSIQTIEVGKRLGAIGNAIYKCAKGHGLSVVEKYGGHGIDTAPDGTGIPHAAPFVPNKSNANEGIRAQVGMILAIEPLFVLGHSNRTITDNDGWTVSCDDLCSHHEHTVFIHEDRIEILTDRSKL